jgi:hypothetical protein
MGASPVEGRRTKSEDANCENEQVEVTPALLVGDIKFNGVTAGSTIELTVQVLPGLYLETIALIKGGPADAIEGSLSVGTLKERGSAKATISAELYDFVLSQVPVSNLLIALEHSETRVTHIRFENI